MTLEEAREQAFRRIARQLDRTLAKLDRWGALPPFADVLRILPPWLQQQVCGALERPAGGEQPQRAKGRKRKGRRRRHGDE